MRRISAFLVLVVLLAPTRSQCAGDPAVAAQFINALGVDLLSKATGARENALLSPYSIQSALAMTYAGADGDTKREMAAVLHYPASDAEPHDSLHELQALLDKIADDTAKEAAHWGPSDPITYVVANRLFGQKDYEFRQSFTQFVQQKYGAPMQLMDFKRNAEGSRKEINAWVGKQTRDRIQDLIPAGNLDAATRLVLVNAIYLKAPWLMAFPESETKPRPFHVDGKNGIDVPTMARTADFGYEKRNGYTLVALPYIGRQLQFVILIPDATNGLEALQKKLTPELLAASAQVGETRVLLEMPKFRLEPAVMPLKDAFMSLGMKTAFDIPERSANFDRMAPRRPDDYLLISEIFHKAFLAIDEKGTEAAAATAVVTVIGTSAMAPLDPIEVKVDRPFLFAIQHRESGACLFLGRVVDPR